MIGPADAVLAVNKMRQILPRVTRRRTAEAILDAGMRSPRRSGLRSRDLGCNLDAGSNANKRAGNSGISASIETLF
jgi:hypothetical protein